LTGLDINHLGIIDNTIVAPNHLPGHNSRTISGREKTKAFFNADLMYFQLKNVLLHLKFLRGMRFAVFYLFILSVLYWFKWKWVSSTHATSRWFNSLERLLSTSHGKMLVKCNNKLPAWLTKIQDNFCRSNYWRNFGKHKFARKFFLSTLKSGGVRETPAQNLLGCLTAHCFRTRALGFGRHNGSGGRTTANNPLDKKCLL